MTDRFFGRAALVLVPLALAACGGGRETSGDAPANGVAVNTTRRDAPPIVVGGDTAMTAAPASDVTQTDGGSQAPAASPGTDAPVSAGSGTASPTTPGATEPAAPARVGRQDANAILRRVEQTAEGIRSLEADFVQTLHVPLLNTDRTSRGKLYQRKPDRFLMRFSEPAGDVMVADGRHFWIYYPSSDRTQVVRTSIAEGGEQADFQRQFLSNATERFVATLNGQETVDGRPTYALTLVPKRNSPYKVIRVWVDQQDNLVRRFEMTEENDSVRRLELRNLKVNQPLGDALFAFTPPAGTQVIDQ
ncbi:MAG TPA: outer membrane lipoprotein chaperone LolA [Longimicrobium sp.]|nr:outer membrane lipoprotein chaperone LolA [Longimicrobium sp.]